MSERLDWGEERGQDGEKETKKHEITILELKGFKNMPKATLQIHGEARIQTPEISSPQVLGYSSSD